MEKLEQVTPYGATDKSKKEQVAEMFNNISKRYDFLNHFLSLGIDKGWRRNVVKLAKAEQPERILDLATGTADQVIALRATQPTEIVGMDISEGMLAQGRAKVAKKGLEELITLSLGDSENLPFDDDHFDVLTVSFGVRNYENLEKGLAEMLRVTKPGGKVIILEFSQPEKFPMKQLFGFYSKRILPAVGRIVSKDSRAYTYLPDSVEAFPYGTDFTDVLDRLGYRETSVWPQTFGIASIYTGTK
ncbi:MAG: bifunctional demethylmenaquinone methyltransferase/2-methoxy-6-polyprenyl-1,4-benzoquinol methylase UbiE [Flavobacteriales bacterium]|nr:bifunctional demethylmenaquinone methyltransferase/2-methoxy-6-polyprenyl-1,4-benzoquinol methylase UbiE [Flavobacteriales bacterium]